MKDDAGVVQFWTVSPNGGAPRQITRNASDISSTFTWSADGRWLAHTLDGRVCVTEVATGKLYPLTSTRDSAGVVRPEAGVFSPDGKFIAYLRDVAGAAGTFSQVFIVSMP
jgi:Tol biopolymer transport system component